MKRKMMGVLAVLALALVLSGGVAMAKFVACTGGSCVGTEFSDTISGLDSASIPDTISGLGARDEIATNAGNDFADGGPGDDAIHGQLGIDRLFGGAGNDFIDGGPGIDTIRAGAGNDSIVAAEPKGLPAEKDDIDCGEDANGLDVDTVQADQLDVVKNCEKVFRTTR
jgi:Ca2+-binding RTX toxin-like protein